CGPIDPSAAVTVLRSSIATVVTPTPPRRGVTQPATSPHRSSTSDRALRPSHVIPPPITQEPGATTSGVIMFGTPAAPTTMSARRVYAAQSLTPVCTTVTAALPPRSLRDNSNASGRPSVGPRPTITTDRPATGTL